MSAQAFVLACALGLLGRSPDRFAPIRIIEMPPADVSANAQGFVNRAEGAIYLVASAPAFRVAESAQSTPWGRGRCVEHVALKMIASVIVHEQWHLTHGHDEKAAYQLQLRTLVELGLGPDTTAFRSVARAMRVVLKHGRVNHRTPPQSD